MPYLEQVHIGRGSRGYESVALSPEQQDTNVYAEEFKQYTARLLKTCPEHIWPKASYKTSCPRPILVSKRHHEQLQDLHEALNLAITDIVQRWFSDAEARFPERMPLSKPEEDLLRWLDHQVESGNLQPFSECRGSWRPDFLVEGRSASTYNRCEKSNDDEVFCITEINARFSFNGFMHEALGQEALDAMNLKELGLASATSSTKIIDGLMGLFQPSLPLHLLKGDEKGIDIHMFVEVMQQRHGITPRPITPADLRLVPDPQARGGFRLCCVAFPSTATATAETWITANGERVEEIHQVGLELHQRELLALAPEMLRQLSLRCFNDMRTVLLVHDKRMLGIVRQELDQLVARSVLTAAQAGMLQRGIADTIIPGSQEMRALLQETKLDPELRKEFLFKPVRSGKGAGIVFGDEASQEEWMARLEQLQSVDVVPDVTCIVQKRITPRLYDMVLTSAGHRVRYPLVGTYHAVHGKFLGLGIWRSSGDRICAVSSGGSWICSVMSLSRDGQPQ